MNGVLTKIDKFRINFREFVGGALKSYNGDDDLHSIIPLYQSSELKLQLSPSLLINW
jgi:hypothetical protein